MDRHVARVRPRWDPLDRLTLDPVSEPEFAAFVTDHASVVHGLVLLVTGDREITDEIVDAAWPEVYQRWPVIAASRRPRAHALAPFVARAVRYAESIRREQEPAGATVL